MRTVSTQLRVLVTLASRQSSSSCCYAKHSPVWKYLTLSWGIYIKSLIIHIA